MGHRRRLGGGGYNREGTVDEGWGGMHINMKRAIGEGGGGRDIGRTIDEMGRGLQMRMGSLDKNAFNKDLAAPPPNPPTTASVRHVPSDSEGLIASPFMNSGVCHAASTHAWQLPTGG